MGNVISEEEIDESYSLLPSGEYANTSTQNRFSYNSGQQWNEDAREVERLVREGNKFCKHAHYKRALKYYEEAWEIEVHRLGLSENHMSVAITNNNMGIVLNKLGRFEEAMEKYWESLRIKKMKLMKDHVNIAGTLHNMGVVHRNKKEYDLSMACYEEALRIRTLRLGRRSAHCAATLQNMGIVHRERCEYNRALLLLEEALDINQLKYGEDSIDVANILNDIGKVYMCKEEYKEAMQYYDEASYLLHKAKLASDHIYMRENKSFIKEVKQALGDEVDSSQDEEDNSELQITENSNHKDDGDDVFGNFTEARFTAKKLVTEGDLLNFVSTSATEDSQSPTDAKPEDALLVFLSSSDNEPHTTDTLVHADEPLLSLDSDREVESSFVKNTDEVVDLFASNEQLLIPSSFPDKNNKSSSIENSDEVTDLFGLNNELSPPSSPPPPIPSIDHMDSTISSHGNILPKEEAPEEEFKGSVEQKNDIKNDSFRVTVSAANGEVCNEMKRNNLVKEHRGIILNSTDPLTENTHKSSEMKDNAEDSIDSNQGMSEREPNLSVVINKPEQSSAILWGYD